MKPTQLVVCNDSLRQPGGGSPPSVTADKPAEHINLALEARTLGALGRKLRLEPRDLGVALLKLLVEGGGPALEPGHGLLQRPELVVGPLGLELGDAGCLGGVAPGVPQLRARLCLRLPGGRSLVLGAGRLTEGVRVPGLSLVRGGPLGLRRLLGAGYRVIGLGEGLRSPGKLSPEPLDLGLEGGAALPVLRGVTGGRLRRREGLPGLPVEVGESPLGDCNPALGALLGLGDALSALRHQRAGNVVQAAVQLVEEVEQRHRLLAPLAQALAPHHGGKRRHALRTGVAMGFHISLDDVAVHICPACAESNLSHVFVQS